MKQILQHLNNGVTELADVPSPRAGHGQLLIRSSRSLVSAGTERMLVDFGKAGWLDKARQQPDKVRQVLDKARTDGVLPTLAAVRNKLGQPIPVGYCNVGVVIEVGAGVSGFRPGDRVASNGKHAEMVAVPVNLCARVPDQVDDEAAAFTVLASIALQGLRLAQPTLGEAVVVTGLGLIGLVAVQLLRAQGCRVLGIDVDTSRLHLARGFGAEVVDLSTGQDPVAAAAAFSRERGVDAVLITASTRSNEPIHQAALMCRKRGRIVLVGVTGLELSRADFFEKELTFQISCSYGPGRYDPSYEDKGQDYPIGFVRWTEQRNFEAVLDLLAQGKLDVASLVSHRFTISEAERAYAVVSGAEPSLGILLSYPEQAPIGTAPRSAPSITLPAGIAATAASPCISLIGSGNYAGAVLLPALKRAGVRLRQIASTSGVSSAHLGRKFGFELATTDSAALLADSQTDAVVISTRHNTHAEFVVRALEAGRHVFVEKPLATTHADLARIEAAVAAAPRQILMVAFNRRFAPHVQRVRELLTGVPGPKVFVLTVNAGDVGASHWTQDPSIGGGRLLGEGCHFIDLLRHLADSPVVDWHVAAMAAATRDTASITMRFAGGSLGTVHYLANGSRAFPKERLEVFAAGRVLQVDNFRRLTGFGWPGFRKLNLWQQDKGQRTCVQAFVEALRQGSASPIAFTELIEVARLSIDIEAALR